jgi:holin-like protein
MLGFAILLAFNLLGLILHSLGVPLPANVLGMILFAAALFLRLVRVEWVHDAATILLRHLMLLFVPTIVAVVTMPELLKAQWLPITAGMVVSLFASMLAAAFVGRWLMQPTND